MPNDVLVSAVLSGSPNRSELETAHATAFGTRTCLFSRLSSSLNNQLSTLNADPNGDCKNVQPSVNGRQLIIPIVASDVAAGRRSKIRIEHFFVIHDQLEWPGTLLALSMAGINFSPFRVFTNNGPHQPFAGDSAVIFTLVMFPCPSTSATAIALGCTPRPQRRSES